MALGTRLRPRLKEEGRLRLRATLVLDNKPVWGRTVILFKE